MSRSPKYPPWWKTPGWYMVIAFYIGGFCLCVALYDLAHPPSPMGDSSYSQRHLEAQNAPR